MELAEPVAIEGDAKPWGGRDGDRSVDELQHPRLDQVLGLPRVVGVARVGEVGAGGGEVDHRGETDAEVAVAVHREPEAERLGDPAQQRGAPQTAPQVVVGQHDLHGVGRDRRRQVLKRDDAHVGGERHVGAGRDLRHAGDAGGGVLEVFDHAVEPVGDLSEVSGVQPPLGSSRSGRPGKASCRASIAVHSSSGGSTPPLSLSDPNPQPSTIRCAWATSGSGPSASPHSSGPWPG